MTRRSISICMSSCLAVCLLGMLAAAEPVGPTKPNVYCLDPASLTATKASLASDPGPLKPALDALISSADRAWTVNLQSVMDNAKIPPRLLADADRKYRDPLCETGLAAAAAKDTKDRHHLLIGVAN